MEQQHTQEPWRANDAQADIDGPNGEPVAVCYCNDDKGDDAIANARRIVACVNACAGISTENLEDDCFSKMREDRDMLIKQRDELLALIKNDAFTMSFQSLGQYRTALIASAKGGAA